MRRVAWAVIRVELLLDEPDEEDATLSSSSSSSPSPDAEGDPLEVDAPEMAALASVEDE